MIPYILIYWVIGSAYVGGGMVTGQAAFNDQAACEAALDQVKDAWAGRTPTGATYGVAGGVCAAQSTVVVPK